MGLAAYNAMRRRQAKEKQQAPEPLQKKASPEEAEETPEVPVEKAAEEPVFTEPETSEDEQDASGSESGKKKKRSKQ